MLKKIILYIINFFFVVSLFAFISVVILSNTVLNKQFVISTLEKNNYYKKTYYNINEDFKNYIMQSGLEESILEDLYTQEKVDKDINKVIDAVYEGKEIKIETYSIRNKLDKRIKSALEENNRIPDAEEEQAIETFKNAIVDAYTNGIAFAEKYVGQAAKIVEKVQNIVPVAQMTLGIATTILLVLVLAINHKLNENLKAIGVAFTATGILGISLKMLVSSKIENILILNSTFSENLIYLINKILGQFFAVGIIMVILGIIGIIIGCKENRK